MITAAVMEELISMINLVIRYTALCGLCIVIIYVSLLLNEIKQSAKCAFPNLFHKFVSGKAPFCT